MYFANLSLSISFDNETKALELLNNYLNGFDEVLIHGLTGEKQKCEDIVVEKIISIQDDEIIELYKPKIIKEEYVKSNKKNISVNDIVVISGFTYMVIEINNEYNLYSKHKKEFYFSQNLSNIREIDMFIENNEDIEIYKYV